MQVVLLEDIKGVGKRNEVKNVADGYARNFLIPRKLAVRADEKALKAKQHIDEKEEAHLTELKKKAIKLEKEPFLFSLKTGNEGEVFGSVSSADIKKALEEKGFKHCEIEERQGIKKTGENKIHINLGRGVRAEVTIVVTPEK
ncbi:MAG: 50S ribosomal protein L9 [Candidatus Harrisonbacteria bacterium CG10_big_fil_rev_8_21_14_0_10_42_17]|uniref:Large ribosomal subunit protein bL9 n=1 Tax=Candidatus Harrisonbacteria bacterium CG10_big_fil_rev_8_21_14_0_10_42_17 TaxID=1974584 RepID=A0A2M6WH38_9BACT|nr:MAG: 50S ribosomal protein L9 [Candidatus Harrisonbacteria bacterium CG10_big_fil_rev_8_21_14_0_10_42_17]